MPYTLGQAAKATGKSKMTIQRAIKSGRISAARNDDGTYLIDPAELHRMFQPVSDDRNKSDGLIQNETLNRSSVLQAENEALRERLSIVEIERTRERQILQGTVDDLRHRLDTEAEERRKAQTQLTALLTDQRAKPEPPTAGLWQRLFGRR